MLLERVRIVGLGPFDQIEVDFCDRPGEPRPLTVIHGEGGTGKTTLLAAIAATRPAHHIVQTSVWRRPGASPHTVCAWRLGSEDPERPHPLEVATPGFSAMSDDKEEQLRRRELAHFDRRHNEHGGFAFVGMPGTRRYPRASLVIGDPSRTVLRPDVRGAPGFQDASGVDLTRAIKLILAYAGLSAALTGHARGQSSVDPRSLGVALDEALGELLGLIGHSYRGLSPRNFEPRFELPSAEVVPFDALSSQARELVALAAISVHQLWIANRGADPRACEGVIAIDDLDLHQSIPVQHELPSSLRRILPKAQWILATSSPMLAHAAELGSVVTLRRDPDSARIELYQGELAITH
ncbi:AAA family ATPase [Pseudenhygromyxa sp. WMMC2535]|uniref:ATP-binding protein n=1 Tax=Pseudenhygromyxa sp. WMMC2535 TaxID=2712867 RepID=UPI0015534FC9|nr:ATP-binding protein [Pseudenhygromyxa sp. WMMC2535]NVB36908.1 AAA family ATPase [Pseudenhygromyxa sp. WMMC2535]